MNKKGANFWEVPSRLLMGDQHMVQSHLIILALEMWMCRAGTSSTTKLTGKRAVQHQSRNSAREEHLFWRFLKAVAHNGQRGKEHTHPQTCWGLLRMFIDPVFLIVWCISQKSAAVCFSATEPPLPRLQWVFSAIVCRNSGDRSGAILFKH